HERKLKMHELSDACLTLPGGFGTMEEFFEMITWAQLGLHEKPNGILNVNGFYNALITQVDHMAAEGLLKPKHRSMLLIDDNIDTLLDKMTQYKAPDVEEWLKKKRL
ncbi:MAG: LOG family protein, partial [Vicingaceae bacterium]